MPAYVKSRDLLKVFLISAFLLALLTACEPSTDNTPPEVRIISKIDALPVAKWSFDNCDASDDTGNGYDGNVSGNIECVDGKNGKAFSFDGRDDHITLRKTLNPNDMRAISFWINSRGPDGINNKGMVLAKYSWYGTRSFLIWSFSGDWSRVGATLFYDGKSYNGDTVSSFYEDIETVDKDKYTLVNNRELEIGVWQHIVVNVTEEEIEIWVGGEIANKVKREYKAYFNSGEATYIGNAFLIGDDFFYNERLNGVLDDLTVYQQPLKGWEIEWLAANSSAGLEYLEDEKIIFFGQGSDLEDGDLGGSSLIWSSNIDGQIGTGKVIETTLSVGTHVITLKAIDSKGSSSADSIHVKVLSRSSI